MSQAQTTLDGAPLADPFYAGEYLWYNPGVPWAIAASSKVTGVPPLRFHARAGGWLDLIAPSSFYAMSASLFGSPAGLAAGVGYVFFTCGDQPVWMCATYSPWMFASQPGQGLFFLSLLALITAHKRRDPKWYAGAGLLAGLTFLTHTAPAAILAVLFTGQAVARWREAGARASLREAAVYGLCFVVIAAPFLWIILGHYHARVVNPVPMVWEVNELSPEGFPALLKKLGLIVTVPATIGFVALLRERSIASRLVLIWLLVSVTFVLYGISRHLPAIKPLDLPVPFPTFHWWIYVSAALSLLFGIGCSEIARRMRPKSAAWSMVIVAVLVVLVFREWPDYRQRDAFTNLKDRARNQNPEFIQVTTFIRRATSPSAVFLASHGAAILIVGPAGRKTVAMQPHFSNPYVDYESRARDRDDMFRLLANGQIDEFYGIAQRYGVSHVIANSPDDCRAIAVGGGSALQLLYQFPQFCVHAVQSPRLSDVTPRFHRVAPILATAVP